MCFVSPPRDASPDAGAAGDAAAQSERARRRNAQGYGASLLTSPGSLGPAPTGRRTLGGQ
jgi:hypothetical protein